MPAEPSVEERWDSPWMLPPWVGRGGDGWWATLRRALGTELDDARTQLRRIGDQTWIPHADFALSNWERQLGMPTDEALSIEQRRSRLLERRIGFTRPIGPRLRELVRVLTGQTLGPTLTVRHGYWAVFKLAEIGWPGDAVFLEAERRLYRAMPAAFGGQVAPWDTVNGLTFHQANLMGYAALNVLTYLELNGATPQPAIHPDASILGLGMSIEEQEE